VIDGLIEVGRGFRMEKKFDKNQDIKNPKITVPIQIMIDQNNWRMWNILATCVA
jgi:hypothetical protein